MKWQYAVDAALVLCGLAVIASHYLARPAPLARRDQARELARVRHEIGLAHRLAARLIGVSRNGLEDEGFWAVAELYVLSRPYALAAVPYMAVVETSRPLLEIEELLERMEAFSSRVRRWRPRGRARGKG